MPELLSLRVLQMANTLYLKDGSREVILGDSSNTKNDLDLKRTALERLLRDKLGDDAADFFDSYITEFEDLYIDRDDYEAISDGYFSLCCDAKNGFEKIVGLLITQPRLNRKELLKVAQSNYENLQKNL